MLEGHHKGVSVIFHSKLGSLARSLIFAKFLSSYVIHSVKSQT